jgi:iron complex transport system substrate-binding protein
MGAGLAGGLGLFAGCSASSDEATSDAPASPGTRTIQTAKGAVEVPSQPQRIVAVGYDTPFQLMSVSVTPVGIYDYSQWYDQYPPDQVAFLKPIDTIGEWGTPDLEKIAALNPDLIVGVADELKDGVYEQLSKLAPTTLFDSPTRGDWETAVTNVADVVGASDALAAGKKEYEDLLARLQTDYQGPLTEQTWISYSFGDSDGQFSVQFPSGATGGLMQQLGMTLGSVIETDDPDAGYVSYSVEKADLLKDVTVALHPLDAAGKEYASLVEVQQTKIWQQLPFNSSARDFGLVYFYGVNTYQSAVDALQELEDKVLEQL